MAALDRITAVATLLEKWKEVEQLHQSPVAILDRLADVVENEYEVYLKSDPDPFDDRHPARNDPDCTYAHVLKSLTKNEEFVDVLLNSYLMAYREDFKICCVASRLLFDMMCCLEMEQIYQETEGFIPRLYKWAEDGEEPLRSYSVGLLGMAMGMEDLTASYRANNSQLVPIIITRLNSLKEVKDFSQAAINDFSKLKSGARIKIKPTSIAKKQKEVSSDAVGLPGNAESSSKANQSMTKRDVHKKAKQRLNTSSFKLSPLTISMQIRFMFRYLTPLGEYQEFLQVAFELEVRSLITHFISLKYVSEDHIIFQALQYLTSLMCHKKFALEFVSHGGIEKLLQIPKPSFSATAVSCCYYYLAYVEDALERICLLPQPVLGEVVKYVLWLLECSHYSGRCHATIFFSLTFAFRAILVLFDENDGLRKLINMLSTLEILTESPNVLSDDYLFDCRQTVKHTCMALRRYFDAHVAMKADVLRRIVARTRGQSPPRPIPAYKSVTITQRGILDNVELILENSHVVVKWPPVDMMRDLQGFSLLIQILCMSAEWSSYTARNDVTRLALDTLAVLTVSFKSQLALIEPVTLPTGVTEVGIKVLLRAAEGEFATDGEIQKAALLVLCNCVSPKPMNSMQFFGQFPKAKRGFPKNPEEIQDRLWNCVRANNGIRVLLSLLLVKTPVCDADSIRGLACKALCGLARSDQIRQIMSKLSMIHSGQLQFLMREPILSDNASLHGRFCQYVSELLGRVLGKTIQDSQSYLTLSRITKADVVAQTQITYPEQEILHLCYRHFLSKGLTETAAVLLKEANLPQPGPNPTLLSPQVTSPHKMVCFNVSRPIPLVVHSPSVTPTSSPGIPTVHRVGSTNPGTPLNKHNFPNVSKRSIVYPVRASSPPTLDSIVTQYLRDQHALCKNPVAACPPFSLLRPHRCPEPKQRRHASVNIASRLAVHQVNSCYGGCEGNKLNRKYLFSRFRSMRVLRVLDEVSYYTCATFLPDTRSILIGTQAGEVKLFNINTAQCESSHNCHRSTVTSCQPSKDGQLLLTSSPFGTPGSVLWSVGETFNMKTTFPEARHVQFNKQTLNKVIGTRGSSADIYDLTSGQKMMTLSDTKSNNYHMNIATFNSSDELVLNDGVLWDVRAKQVIHKFDKFNNYLSGVFHPSDLEIIINSEIWDLRSFHLLDTCSSLDQCRVAFNNKGDVIFGVRHSHHAEGIRQFESSFRTIDATNYQPIATYDVKKAIYSLAINDSDTMFAVVENQGNDDTNIESICRLYEIGRLKGEDEDEEEEDEEEDEEDLESVDEDDLGDFIDDDGEEHGVDILNVIDDILGRNNNNDDDDDDDDDDDEDMDDDDDDDDDSEFDDDIRFLLPESNHSSSSSDTYSDFSADY